MTITVNSSTAGNQAAGVLRSTLQVTTPVGVAPSGSVAANGAITLGTALPRIYADGIFLRLPAGAAYAGSAAAFFWCVMSSTTVGTIFDNTFAGVPEIPATATPIVAAGPGAFTGVTGTITAISKSLPAWTIPLNGTLYENAEFTYNLTAGAKVFTRRLAGTNLTQVSRTSSGGHDCFSGRLRNKGTLTRNFQYLQAESSPTSAAGHTEIVADISTILVYDCQVSTAVATDYGIYEGATLFVIP